MADKKKQAGGDAQPSKQKKDTKGKESETQVGKKAKGKVSEKALGKKGNDPPPEPEELEKTPSQIARDEAEMRAMERKNRFKRHWPEVTKVKFSTKPWHPPPPPQKMPPIPVDLPELTLRRWIPPYRRRRRPRPKLMRIPPEEMTQELYEYNRLKKIWHNFTQVEANKMILQGSIGCNSKKYSSTSCGAQTACIAAVCRALLEEKTEGQLVKRDVDDCIDAGDRYWRQCMKAMKCYKGKPSLELNQLLTSFFFRDTRYTIKLSEIEKGLLAKHPDNIQTEPDFMSLMDKRIGSTYSMILTIGGDQHFYMWGHPPPPEAGSQVKTVCYMFDPHMLNELGQPQALFGAGAFLRYAGVASFVLDFLANYGDLDSAKKGTPKPPITITEIEVVQQEPLIREPTYDLDLKALQPHCKSHWDAMNINTLLDKKIYHGQYPLCSLSAVSLATSRATNRKKVRDFYQKTPKEPPPQLPIQPEKAPPALTNDQIMAMRGEDFFLYCPRTDIHSFGRDDMLPRPKSETIMHSPVDIADKNYHSQFAQLDVDRWILHATRHAASYRYQIFKTYTAICCCMAALAMLRRLRARGWNEDTLDETLDLGYNIFRESLVERGGPIRRLVLGELKETFTVRDQQYTHKERNVAVWGKIISNNPKVFDLCRGIEHFFKEADSGLLQIPGEYETAIWNEGGLYYLYHPWPADRFGYKVGLQDGGKACLLKFNKVSRMCEHLIQSSGELRRKPFSISDVGVRQLPSMPPPINQYKTVAPNRWIVRGRFHEGDERFPEEHRGKQATPTSIVAIALANIVDPSTWTSDEVDETLVRGDILYQNTMEHLERMGISLDTPLKEEAEEEEEETTTGMLAAADVMNRFQISEYDCIETEVQDSEYNGSLAGGSGEMSLKASLKDLFKRNKYAVLTARGGSTAVWKHDDCYYVFDPHGCDEKGFPSEERQAKACLIRVQGSVDELATVIESQLSPGPDDSFNLSPVSVTATKLNVLINAPETKLESKDFGWIAKGTAAVMQGPRGENSAIGKAATKALIPADDLAGRTIALPSAAAFTASAVAVPPPMMHQDHMYNFIDAGADYYINHVKKTGKKEILPEDLNEKFEMGANTFSIELGEPIRLPLRLPDEPPGEGEEEDEDADQDEIGEEEEEEKEIPMKQIKDALFKVWNDSATGETVHLLVGDYHQLGVWMAAGGKVVAFDPAPALAKGMLTPQRISKGDELRLQRIKDEMAGEGGDDAEEEDEELGEGEAQPEPEPQFVPPESVPMLMVFATPGEFIDKLVFQAPLDIKQAIAPYKLYPVTVTNELTSVLKDKRPPAVGDEEAAGDEEAEEVLVEALEDEAMGKYFTRMGRSVGSLRGRVAQDEAYFVENPNRDKQDTANAIMGIVVDHIEPYQHWKPALIDAILKYGDRLHTMSLPNASKPPFVAPGEIAKEFHVTNFNVRLEIEPDAVTGDIKAGATGSVLSLLRALNRFYESNKYGVLCCKNHCVAVMRGCDDKSYAVWNPHGIGPTGKLSPVGCAGMVLYSTVEQMAEILKENIEGLDRPGSNNFSISPVKCFWEFSQLAGGVSPQGAVPDEGYEWKVITAYVEMARGRTILRGSRPPDLVKFAREALLQSSAGAIVGACMSHIRRPHLWTRRTVDAVTGGAAKLFSASLPTLGYEFRPGDDVLSPMQVLKRFVLGVNYIRYNLEEVSSGKLEQIQPVGLSVRAALERFFESHTHGILWCIPHAVAVWRVVGSPSFYMMEPNSCGPTGLRLDAQDDGAACVLTFTSPKLMAYAYLQNFPVTERPKHEFHLYAMAITVQPITKIGAVEPPLVRAPPGAKLVPATSKVGIDGSRRRADEGDRKHPPGSTTCLDAQRASDKRDAEENRLKGQRNTSGWLVLSDGTQFLSAGHSLACKRFSAASRGNQALSCAVMAVAMSRVEDVCRWCSSTLEQILDSGDQLHQDSYLHFKPKGTKLLTIEQILRKFYTPGNCVCRVVVYKPRQTGRVDSDLEAQLTEFFREEKSGVFVAGNGDFAVALFRTPRGYYMFDPLDRDRYGRAVAPPCTGKARACFSQYPSVQMLAEKLGCNIPPVLSSGDKDSEGKDVSSTTRLRKEVDEALSENATKPLGQQQEKNLWDAADKFLGIEEDKGVHFEEPASFTIYGMNVTSLRRLNQHER